MLQNNNVVTVIVLQSTYITVYLCRHIWFMNLTTPQCNYDVGYKLSLPLTDTFRLIWLCISFITSNQNLLCDFRIFDFFLKIDVWQSHCLIHIRLVKFLKINFISKLTLLSVAFYLRHSVEFQGSLFSSGYLGMQFWINVTFVLLYIAVTCTQR